MSVLYTLIYIIIGIAGIDIMILIHELGHFTASRLCGVKVECLSVGLGPKIISWKDRKGTQYVIRLIPFGGNTKMFGYEDLKTALINGDRKIEKLSEGSLYSASPLKRIIIYLCGPLFNVLFAIVCFTTFQCLPVMNASIPPKIVLSADYSYLYPQACPAEKSGLKTGDTIVSVNGRKTETYEDLEKVLSEEKEKGYAKVLTKENTEYMIFPQDGVFGILPFREAVVGSVNAVSAEKFAGLKAGDIILFANKTEVKNMFDLIQEAKKSDTLELVVFRKTNLEKVVFKTNGTLNFTLKSRTVKTKGATLSEALEKSFKKCLYETGQFFNSLSLLFKGKTKLSQTIGGTIYASENIGIMTNKGFAASFNTGVRVVLYVLASVSLSLAAANLLPITALDGGLILISFAELITRRTLNPKTYVILQSLGILTVFIIIPVVKFFN